MLRDLYCSLLAICVMSIAKGYGDATWGDPIIHPGTKHDLWHIVTRYFYFYVAIIGWLVPRPSVFTRKGLAIVTAIAGVASLAFFRLGVLIAGKYGAWYG